MSSRSFKPNKGHCLAQSRAFNQELHKVLKNQQLCFNLNLAFTAAYGQTEKSQAIWHFTWPRAIVYFVAKLTQRVVYATKHTCDEVSLSGDDPLSVVVSWGAETGVEVEGVPVLEVLCLQQVRSLSQFYSVDFSQSRIGVKKVRFQQTHNQGLRQLLLTVSWDLCA